MSEARSVETPTHGRFLISGRDSTSSLIVVGFHGYGENDEKMMERLDVFAASHCRLAVQALNRFYNAKTQEICASWMTRQDRELAIADNIEYIRRTLADVERERAIGAIVFAGFSQGTAMAWRAATSIAATRGVIALGGDIPPEISDAQLRGAGRILLGRGATDEWYSAAKLDADIARLRAASADFESITFDGGHEWSGPFHAAAKGFLRTFSASA